MDRPSLRVQGGGAPGFCSFSRRFFSRQCLPTARVALSSHSRLCDNSKISVAQKYLCALGAGFPSGLSMPILMSKEISQGENPRIPATLSGMRRAGNWDKIGVDFSFIRGLQVVALGEWIHRCAIRRRALNNPPRLSQAWSRQ